MSLEGELEGKRWSALIERERTKIDKQTLELLDKMGFVEASEQKRLFRTEIENGKAFIDFRKEDGRRYAIIGGQNIPSKDADTIPILKLFKEERKKIEDALSAGLGLSKEVKHDTTTKGIPKVEQDIILNHAAQEHRQSEGEAVKSPSQLKPESPTDKQDFKTNNMPEATIAKSIEATIIPPGVKFPPPATSDKAQPPIPPAASQSPNLYEFFLELVGAGGIIEIFGDTGSLKTQASVEIAKAAMIKNKSVFYLDTEGKVGLKNKKDLGNSYKYLPIWEDILTTAKDLSKYDLLIIDSVGLPISAKYPTFKLNEQGDAWNDLMMLVGDYLKSWAYKNNALVIITNQPKSTFMKSEQELKRLDPLGDKVHFAPNLILRATKTIIPGHYDKDLKKAIPPKSIGTFISHRSPDFMDDIEIFSIIKNDNELEINIPKYILKRIRELKE